MSELITFRPHARLLTMLGEQLIKNDRIALVELVKNSYDADATMVEIDFQDFDEKGRATATSSIVITDNGIGMSEETVRGAWMNPATPSKRDRKREQGKTPRGRVMQGEKGIGRFASFKLGSIVQLTTRGTGETEEVSLLVDLTELDNDSADAQSPAIYLDEIGGNLVREAPRVFKRDAIGMSTSQHGTRIEVSALRSAWGVNDFQAAFADMERMQPLMWRHDDIPKQPASAVDSNGNGFEVRFLVDGVDQHLADKRASEFEVLFERAVLRVTDGQFDDNEHSLSFKINDRLTKLDLSSGEVRGLRPFRDRFGADPESPEIACGPFRFEFYIFDFSNTAPAQHQLDRTEKDLLKEHRVYLYRDGIRVYPYGDPEDDWLQIDRFRATLSARSMFSNDQTLGYVSITQADNPTLQDKTNREGLIDAGRSSGDLIALLQTVLSYLRSRPYDQYSIANRRTREQSLRGRVVLDEHISTLIEHKSLPASLKQDVLRIGESITSERELSKLQLERTQDLAGVGLSVETASHDLIAAGGESLRLARSVLRQLRELGLGSDNVYSDTTSLVQRLEFVDSRFQDVQGLFVSTRQKRASLDLFMYLRRVRSMYAGLHRKYGIEFQIDETGKFRAVTTEAALLQCIINLVDNATYWLRSSSHEPRTIRAFASGKSSITITDSGPGVPELDQEYIFEPFYSGKGDTGKGLGLYIAREVGLRNGFTVELGTDHESLSLPGADFVVNFDSVGE